MALPRIHLDIARYGGSMTALMELQTLAEDNLDKCRRVENGESVLFKLITILYSKMAVTGFQMEESKKGEVIDQLERAWALSTDPESKEPSQSESGEKDEVP
mmetsp:Transcript_16204/g.27418  ORF Transcript_16204/g.27418 Transcript_16204/m.27418 type:complete len:102 (+) Transcript_16204:64-369(+)|eukprot:CAMPEP_0168609752 /NCGR_PEP_ID=MMETSP0449_2-20121227/1385_1 /TAXON_ID=1082188 /ORGANISM="Strombidium rassoulzadegani, Strain ras09" /LENGTH=101 /DNA_ID=CAMNT_0008649939 /DNA_START=57 /DNA_END=362 /DNA_ORIENTATION=+